MKRQTKSKAIEAALQAGKHRHSLRYDPKAVADHAYDLGGVAGFRACIALLPDWGLIRAGETKRRLRAEANAMAKKARRK